MDKEQALQVIEQALNAASLKGVYNLQDSAMIIQALQVIKTEEK